MPCWQVVLETCVVAPAKSAVLADRELVRQHEQKRAADSREFLKRAIASPAPCLLTRFSLIIMGTLLDDVTYCCNMIRESAGLSCFWFAMWMGASFMGQ